ncbi:helix-turn-helix domain-containing protein [Chitinophaga barathri]
MVNAEDRKIIVKFGKHLAKLRTEKGLSQRELSHRCRIDYSKIGAMERGEVNLTLVSMVELARGLEISPSLLLNWD